MEPRQIQARFEDGVLKATVPKNEEKTMRHQIQVQGGQGNPQGVGSGQMSERVGQQATDVQVQQGNDAGGQNGQREPKTAAH